MHLSPFCVNRGIFGVGIYCCVGCGVWGVYAGLIDGNAMAAGQRGAGAQLTEGLYLFCLFVYFMCLFACLLADLFVCLFVYLFIVCLFVLFVCLFYFNVAADDPKTNSSSCSC